MSTLKDILKLEELIVKLDYVHIAETLIRVDKEKAIKIVELVENIRTLEAKDK